MPGLPSTATSARTSFSISFGRRSPHGGCGVEWIKVPQRGPRRHLQFRLLLSGTVHPFAVRNHNHPTGSANAPAAAMSSGWPKRFTSTLWMMSRANASSASLGKPVPNSCNLGAPAEPSVFVENTFEGDNQIFFLYQNVSMFCHFCWSV